MGVMGHIVQNYDINLFFAKLPPEMDTQWPLAADMLISKLFNGSYISKSYVWSSLLVHKSRLELIVFVDIRKKVQN